MTLMKTIKLFLAGIIIISVCLTAGCKKFLTVPPPVTQLVTTSVFASDQTAEAAMAGIYSTMESSGGFASGGTGSIGLLSGLSADELTNYSNDPNQVQFFLNQLNKNNSLLYNNLWSLPYQCIYDANAVLEGVTASSQISAPVKKELPGEAKFIRAFCNFYLTHLFGDIPLTTTTDYKNNAIISRSSGVDVNEQIIADLISAESLLAPDYSFSNGERVRPNAAAAAALLARVYLYLGDWKDAEIQATAVINQTNLYALLPDLSQVFLANSTEAIWQLLPNIPGVNTGEGNLYILNSAPVYAALSPTLISSFETGDLRLQTWVADTTLGTDTYFYPFKYKVKYGDVVTEYSMVLRLAEQYLIRAEARTNLNNTTGAAEDINAIRNRAGLANTTATDQPTLLQAIQQERRVELFTEWGHRWFDLIRTNQATTVLAPLKNDWQATDTLYPIPQADIQRDPNLTQNPGY
jgi:starch-binding outer membrane protein, SusD/RagB family